MFFFCVSYCNPSISLELSLSLPLTCIECNLILLPDDLYLMYLRFSLVYASHGLRCFLVISCDDSAMFVILDKIIKRLVEFLDPVLKILQLILTYVTLVKTGFRK